MTQLTNLSLLAKPWEGELPDLSFLGRTARSVQDAFLNKTSTELLPSIVHNCWAYAVQFSKPPTVLAALRICAEVLPRMEREEDKKHLTPFSLKIEGQTHVYPGHFKTWLAHASEFFRRMFYGSFREGSSDALEIKDVSLSNFRLMLNILEHGKSAFPDMEVDSLLDFICQTDQLRMTSVSNQARKILIETIPEMTPEQWGIATTIYHRLAVTDPTIEEALSGYNRGVLSRFKTEKEILEFLEKHRGNLPILNFEGCLCLTGELLKKIVLNFSSLQTLKLPYVNRGKIEGNDLTVLSTLTDLRILKFEQIQNFNGNILTALSTLTLLQQLDISRCNEFSDTGLLILIAQFTYLRSFRFTGCGQVSQVDLAALTQLKKLTELRLESIKISDAHVASFSRLTDLRELSIQNCREIRFEDPAFTSFQTLSQLRIMNLFASNLGNVLFFPRMIQLKKLGLECNINLTDNDIRTLVECLPNLKILDLACCNKLTDKALSFIGKLEKLIDLDLGTNDWMTDAGLIHIAGLTRLRNLSILSTPGVTDLGVAFLAGRLISLQKLNLSSCRNLSDRAFIFLSHLPLQELKLSSCNITIETLLLLIKSLSYLRRLELIGCPQLTREDVARAVSLVEWVKSEHSF